VITPFCASARLKNRSFAPPQTENSAFGSAVPPLRAKYASICEVSERHGGAGRPAAPPTQNGWVICAPPQAKSQPPLLNAVEAVRSMP
jgi:hypothetical protein